MIIATLRRLRQRGGHDFEKVVRRVRSILEKLRKNGEEGYSDFVERKGWSAFKIAVGEAFRAIEKNF